MYQDQGIKLHLFTSPTKLERGADGKIMLALETKDGKKESLEGLDQVLFATGRKPNTKNMGLEELGVELDSKGGVKVTSSTKH